MKLWNYVFMATGLIIVLNVFGIETGSAELLEAIGISFNNGQVTSVSTSWSTFWNLLFNSTTGILTLTGIVGGIAVSFFAKGRLENFIILPVITGILALFVATFIEIIQSALASGSYFFGTIITVLFVPLTIGYILALVEFFRGTD